MGASTKLALSMADVYAWTIDFTHVQKGDLFDVLYSMKRVNGQEVGMPSVELMQALRQLPIQDKYIPSKRRMHLEPVWR